MLNINLLILIGNSYDKAVNIETIFKIALNNLENTSETINSYYDYLIEEIKKMLITGQEEGEFKSL